MGGEQVRGRGRNPSGDCLSLFFLFFCPLFRPFHGLILFGDEKGRRRKGSLGMALGHRMALQKLTERGRTTAIFTKAQEIPRSIRAHAAGLIGLITRLTLHSSRSLSYHNQ